MRCEGRSWLLLTAFILFYITYLLFGALIFSSLERPVEEQLRREIDSLREEFLNRSCVNATALERFLAKVLTARKSGVSAMLNSSGPSQWDLASSMFFANTLVTTVGYGHNTPQSNAGKVFAIIYALIGVPFTMLVLTACIQRLMYPLVLAPVGLLIRLGMQPRSATVVHFVLLLVVVVLSFFLVPAAVFSALEGSWSFLDGVYFSFVSLCTIGLGDYVPAMQPGQKYRSLYQVLVMVYLFVGLMMMYLLLRTFHRMSDLHGLTTLLQLPRCEDSDQDSDREPITSRDRTPTSEDRSEMGASEPLEPGSHMSYNTIHKS
ncbi:potassium channel subfamily K member 6 [Pholidichthys leucotaenia]